MKKLVSFALAVVLCAGLALPALAAELPPDLEADMVADHATDPGAGPEGEPETLPEEGPEEDPTPEVVPEVIPETPPAEGEELAVTLFSDAPPEHSFYAAIMDCAAKGITAGYADGTFRPTANVTNAQFCVMLSRAFYPNDIAKYQAEASKGWYMPNVRTLWLTNATADTTFDNYNEFPKIANNSITRYDMAQVMTNIMARKGFKATAAQKSDAQAKIADYKSIPARYQDAVKNVFALGIITGYANGTFGGNNIMNRGQGCTVIYRMMNYVPAAKPVDPDTSKPAVDDSGKPTVPETPKPETPVTPTQPEAPKTGMLTNGKPITEANVLAMLADLKRQWPDGTYDYNKTNPLYSQSSTAHPGIAAATNTYNVDNGGKVSTRYGCGGYAAFICDSIFGLDATWRKTTYANSRPGDLMIQLDANGKLTHVAVCTEIITANHPDVIEYGWTHLIGKPAVTDNGSAANNRWHATSLLRTPDIWTAYPA